MKKNHESINYGIMSIIFSSIAVTIFFIQVPLGWRSGDAPLKYFFLWGFPLGILFAILGIVFGIKGNKGSKKSIARKGIYLGIAYFVILTTGVTLIGIILSGALH